MDNEQNFGAEERALIRSALIRSVRQESHSLIELIRESQRIIERSRRLVQRMDNLLANSELKPVGRPGDFEHNGTLTAEQCPLISLPAGVPGSATTAFMYRNANLLQRSGAADCLEFGRIWHPSR